MTHLNRLVRFCYPYGAMRRVLWGPLRGARYVVAPGMGATYAFGIGTYNFAFFKRRLTGGAVVYDIGANRGQMTLFFARQVGPYGRVISFEPIRELLQSLQANVEANRWTARVQMVCCAASDEDGRARFWYDRQQCTKGRLHCLLPPGALSERRSVEVQTRTIDGLVQEGQPLPGIMKIDVEGGAEYVLRGARETIRVSRPSIYIELHSDAEAAAVCDELISTGYRAETLSGRHVQDPLGKPENPLWCYWRRTGLSAS